MIQLWSFGTHGLFLSVTAHAFENELLKLFCLNINKKVNRKEALIKIWGDDSYYNARSMDVYIAKLRKHMKLSDENVKIMTLHGYGFKLFASK